MKLRKRVLSTLALGIGTTALQACGGDRAERGLSPPDEQSTPESTREMKMSEEQRRAQEAAQEQATENKEFNEAEKGQEAPQ